MECYHKQYSMYFSLIQHNKSHPHLKNDVVILSTAALHTLKMNWIYYTRSLKTSIRNSFFQYTIIQTNTIFLHYQPQFINAMKSQRIYTENPIFSHYNYTLFTLTNVNVYIVSHTQGTLLMMILTIWKSQKNSSWIYRALVFNTFFILVTPLQFPRQPRKVTHQYLQLLTQRHTTSSCWRSRTYCPHPSPR